MMMHQMYPVAPHNYVYELNKDFHFAAAHYIPSSDAGQCQHTHGHTYFANITIVGDELDDAGFLVNFKTIKDLVHRRFDHSVLNDDAAFSDEEGAYFPTTVVVARVTYEIVQTYLDTLDNKPTCLQVFLRETPTSYCIYRPREASK